MKHFLYLLAIISAGIGMWMNSIFFYGIVGSGISASIYATIGILMDCGKFTFVKLFAISLALNKNFESGAILIFWFITTSISLIAAFGFYSNSMNKFEQKNLLKSQIYKENLLRVGNARQKVEQYFLYADGSKINESKSKIAELENELLEYNKQPALNYNNVNVGTIGSRVGECIGENHYKRKYCPYISDLKSKIWKLENMISNHSNYLSAVSFQQTQSANLSNITSTGGRVLPVFENIGSLLGVSPKTVSIVFIAIAAIVTELFPSLCFFIRARFWPSPIQLENVQPTNYTTTKNRTLSQQSVNNLSVGSLTHHLSLVGNLSAKGSDQRIKHAKKAVMNEVIKPSKYGLQKWSKQNGGLLSDSAITSFQHEWLKEGFIEEYQTANGKMSYRLVENTE